MPYRNLTKLLLGLLLLGLVAKILLGTNLRRTVPDYIVLGKTLAMHSESLCSTAVYQFPASHYDKAKEIMARDWRALPIEKDIVDGNSVETRILFAGLNCADGVGEIQNDFWVNDWPDETQPTGHYLFYGRDMLMIHHADKALMFVVHAAI